MLGCHFGKLFQVTVAGGSYQEGMAQRKSGKGDSSDFAPSCSMPAWPTACLSAQRLLSRTYAWPPM